MSNHEALVIAYAAVAVLCIVGLVLCAVRRTDAWEYQRHRRHPRCRPSPRRHRGAWGWGVIDWQRIDIMERKTSWRPQWEQICIGLTRMTNQKDAPIFTYHWWNQSSRRYRWRGVLLRIWPIRFIHRMSQEQRLKSWGLPTMKERGWGRNGT